MKERVEKEEGKVPKENKPKEVDNRTMTGPNRNLDKDLFVQPKAVKPQDNK